MTEARSGRKSSISDEKFRFRDLRLSVFLHLCMKNILLLFLVNLGVALLSSCKNLYTATDIHRDEAAHLNNPFEIWNFTGFLKEEKTGRTYAVYYLLFHRWHLSTRPEIYIAHFAITDLTKNIFLFESASKISQEILHDSSLPLKIKFKNQSTWLLKGAGGNFKLHLALADHSGYGLSIRTCKVIEKIKYPFKDSSEFYGASLYSFPLLFAEGKLFVENKSLNVSGNLFYDRLWNGVFLLTGDYEVVKMNILLNEGKEQLILWKIRSKRSNEIKTFGVIIHEAERVEYLKDIILEEKNFLASSSSGITYPVEWTLTIPSIKIICQLDAVMDDQEVTIPGAAYWAGACTVKDSTSAPTILGNAFVMIMK